ncbi:FAD-dependent oxidoreductase [Actinokineospora sp. PR83]|uniref:NAD(P)/FAD-dependent oxidoreductase n=1 Tax=Actinokineospora sp. PR83 TaxID=2884908 RepID=UPI001F3828D1|nr:FAD-dependent oxidoreductase [Actinokineospora sp. PR83]MCG8914517.1 FAD-dependent oxidoreductase [Actinokineospora sp. PR83]
MSVRHVVVVGGSTAGATTMRELRGRGYEGRITLLDPEDGTNRPPLSKAVLADPGNDATVGMDHRGLDVEHVRGAAVGLDPSARVVIAEDGERHHYDALVVASGARARRIAAPGQRGEAVLRTLADARRLRERLTTAARVIVVGGGFLGMEVATAAARAGAEVTVVDVEAPLRRHLGPYLADLLVARAAAIGIGFRRSAVRLHADPVSGVELDDGTVLHADVVVSCVGDLPETGWLGTSAAVTAHGVLVDRAARTAVPHVWGAGDVTCHAQGGSARRRPFWANAVTQGRVAAASILGLPIDAPIVDDYFWTDVAGTPLKAVGRLPPGGAPRVLEDAGGGDGVLAWGDEAVVAVGVRRPAPRLRRMLSELGQQKPPA